LPVLWNVSQLLKSSIGAERRYTLDDDGSGIKDLAAAISGDVRMIRTDRGILVMAAIETAVGCECSRCLERFPQPVAFDIEEEFFPAVDIDTGVRIERPEEGFTIDPSHTLDLTDAVRQYALLNLPMKPLCASDCPGVCPTCGARLQLGPCGCEARPADPRWGKIEGLRPSLGGAS